MNFYALAHAPWYLSESQSAFPAAQRRFRKFEGFPPRSGAFRRIESSPPRSGALKNQLCHGALWPLQAHARVCAESFYDLTRTVHSFIAFMLSGLLGIKVFGRTRLWIGVDLLLFYELLCIGVD